MSEPLTIVLDIDGTICEKKKENEKYADVLPNEVVVNKIREYREKGAYIILYTSRQMRTFSHNIGKINAITSKELFAWLDRHQIPYDEVYFGKPWCGSNGFYVDDKAIRPSEFTELSYNEIGRKVNGEW